MKRAVILLSVVFIAAYMVSAQADGFVDERLDRIDAAINAEIEAGRIPGAVALIVKDGEVAYLKSFGHADIGSDTAMKTDNIFRIASMTKAITSVAVMTLYEHGHFRLGDPVAKYIPEFAEMSVISEMDEEGNITATVPATKPIRIIDLLTHSSGIGYPFIPGKLQKTYVEAGVIDGLTTEEITLASQMKLLAQQPLLFEPGSETAYGLNTDLLGYLVEVVSGKSLEQYFYDEIFAPLQMRDTHFYLPENSVDRLATIYSYDAEEGLVETVGDEGGIVLVDPMYPVKGARAFFSGGAGLSSTAEDYARFLQMLLNEGELDGVRVLSRKSVELMRTARVDWDDDGDLDVGFGFYVITDLSEGTELGSVGTYAWGGAFYTSYWIDPSENLVGVFMSQVYPAATDIGPRFNTLVYQSLE